jgi:hypothetical protein
MDGLTCQDRHSKTVHVTFVSVYYNCSVLVVVVVTYCQLKLIYKLNLWKNEHI